MKEKRSKIVRYKEAMGIVETLEKDLKRFLDGIGEIESYPGEKTLNELYIEVDAWLNSLEATKKGLGEGINHLENVEKLMEYERKR